MNIYSVPGDLLFSFFADGTLAAHFSTVSGFSAIEVPDLAALAVARSAGPAGITEEGLLARLAQTGVEAEWKKVLSKLATQRLLVQVGEPSRQARTQAPVFGVGAGGSGGVILRRLLNASPRFHCPDPNPLPFMLGEILEDVESMGDLQSLRLGQDWNRAAIGSLVSQLASASARKAGKARWAQFFAPGQSSGLLRLDELFSGQALYLFPVRHALEFIDEAYRESRVDYEDMMEEGIPLGTLLTDALRDQGGVSHESLARYWVDSNQEALGLAERAPKRVHRVRYDELFSDTEKVFSGVLEFLGETPLAPVQKLPQPVAAPWKSWPPALLKRIAPVVNPTLTALGYPAVAL